MTDNTRPEPGPGTEQGSSPGDSGNRGSRPRRRRRRGSRPASGPDPKTGQPSENVASATPSSAQASAQSNAGAPKSQPRTEGSKSGRSKRRRRGRGRGQGSPSSQSSQGSQNAQGAQNSQSQQAGKAGAGEAKKGDSKGNGNKGNGPKKSNSGRGRSNNNRGRTSRQNTARNRQNPRHAHYNDADPAIETRDETSAGGLVVSGMAEAVGRGGEVDLARIYVALIGRLDRRGRLLWSMPKGHVENGEHHWATAEREVWEETGISGEAFEELGVIDYWFVSEGVRIHKTVYHNLLRYVDGILNDEDPEVTEVTWVPMSELIEHLAYADERKLARIAFDRMPELARKEAEAGRTTPR